MEALRAGAFRPQNACCRASSSISVHTDSRPMKAWTQNSSEVTAMPVLVSSSSLRRSMLSAMAPPHRANTISGSSPARLAVPTQAEEPVMS